jgi:endonuclease III
MNIRAAAKREAVFLQDITATNALSSPLATPIVPGAVEGSTDVDSLTSDNRTFAGGKKDVVGQPSRKTLPTSLTNRKRQPAHSSKKRKLPESVFGEWDELSHGSSKRGDLLEDTPVENDGVNGTQVLPTSKRARRGKALRDSNNSDLMNGVVKAGEEKEAKGASETELADLDAKSDPVTVDLLREALPNSRRQRTELLKMDETAEEDFEEKPRRGSAKQKKHCDVSRDVLDNVDSLLHKAADGPKKTKNKYGLTPGISPFPQHPKPTPEDCEEVHRLLSELHGEVKPPEIISPPSMDVTGCGEVPDLLDALLRTLLSASTTARNANLALKGLQNKFGLRESGIGKGSVNWEAVHEATLDEVINSIKSGGLAKIKGSNIKKILDAVYDQNRKRRDALMEGKTTGKPADIVGAKHETQEQRDIEIMKPDEHLLSMDHVFNMTTDEAMEEMTSLPGIGVKTASCVILFCMKRPSFAVDTHVARHCKWLGWVPTKASRDKIFSHCEVRIPDHLKYSLHKLFLRHGKSCGRCRASTSAGTDEWENTRCPIEHLVARTEAKKQPEHKPAAVFKVVDGKKGRGKKVKRGKQQDDETDESDEGDIR